MTARPPQPRPRATRPQAGTRPPEYVVELWVSPQLRARHPERPLTLWEALEVGHQAEPGTDPQPEPELEAEP